MPRPVHASVVIEGLADNELQDERASDGASPLISVFDRLWARVTREKPSKLPTIQVGIAGEHLVAAELSRRGYEASLTLRNTRGIDILASNREATKSVGIQVKTSQRAAPKWVMSMKAEQDLAENLIYVFVCLPFGAPASFHIVPRQVVGQNVRDTHRQWLATPGRRGQAHRDSDVRVFSDPANESEHGLGAASVSRR